MGRSIWNGPAIERTELPGPITRASFRHPLRNTVMRRTVLVSVVLAFATPLAAQTTPPPAIKTIREADLRRDMEAMAGDALRGREAGTIDEMRASIWVADQMRKNGLEPMGDGGTYFQWWNMRITRVSKISSSVWVNGKLMMM